MTLDLEVRNEATTYSLWGCNAVLDYPETPRNSITRLFLSNSCVYPPKKDMTQEESQQFCYNLSYKSFLSAVEAITDTARTYNLNSHVWCVLLANPVHGDQQELFALKREIFNGMPLRMKFLTECLCV